MNTQSRFGARHLTSTRFVSFLAAVCLFAVAPGHSLADGRPWQRINIRGGTEVHLPEDFRLEGGFGLSLLVDIDLYQSQHIDLFLGAGLQFTPSLDGPPPLGVHPDIGLRLRSREQRGFFAEVAWSPYIFRRRSVPETDSSRSGDERFLDLFNFRLLAGYQFGTVGLGIQLRYTGYFYRARLLCSGRPGCLGSYTHDRVDTVLGHEWSPGFFTTFNF